MTYVLGVISSIWLTSWSISPEGGPSRPYIIGLGACVGPYIWHSISILRIRLGLIADRTPGSFEMYNFRLFSSVLKINSHPAMRLMVSFITGRMGLLSDAQIILKHCKAYPLLL